MAVGRRARLKNRIRNEGVAHLEPHELLEAMLYPFIPRIDTAGIARNLLKRYGSLSRVMKADENDLFSEKGMTRKAAKMLPFQYRAFEYIVSHYVDERLPMNNPVTAGKYALHLPERYQDGGLFLVLLDAHFKLIYDEQLSDKDPEKEAPALREILRAILDSGAAYAFLVHTHPKGKPLLPSAGDYHLAHSLVTALKNIDVGLSDYFAVSEKIGLSFRGEELLGARFRLPDYTRYDWMEDSDNDGFFIENGNGITFFRYVDYEDYFMEGGAL